MASTAFGGSSDAPAIHLGRDWLPIARRLPVFRWFPHFLPVTDRFLGDLRHFKALTLTWVWPVIRHSILRHETDCCVMLPGPLYERCSGWYHPTQHQPDALSENRKDHEPLSPRRLGSDCTRTIRNPAIGRIRLAVDGVGWRNQRGYRPSQAQPMPECVYLAFCTRAN